MKSFDAVIFDMDGVIFDSEKCIVECWRIVAEKYEIPDIENACMKCLGITMQKSKEIMRGLYGQEFPYEQYRDEVNAIFHEKYGEGRLPLKSGVRDLLEYLKNRDKKIALASSTQRSIVLQELSDAGIISYFDTIICGDMVSRSKPAPDIFLKACDELSVEPENAYAVEDSYNGVRASSEGGLHTIMVPDMAPSTEEMEALAEKVLTSLCDVKEYLDK